MRLQRCQEVAQTHDTWGHSGQGAGQSQESSQEPLGCQGGSSPTRRQLGALLC